MQRRLYSTFYLDRYFFGIEVSKVQEFLRFQETTRVPLAPDVIHGLINLRGQIVMSIDLRLRLDFGKRTGDKLPMNVVLRTSEGPVSLLVDQIGDVMEVDEQDFELAPDTLEGIAKQLIQGTYKLKENLLLILDIDKILDIDMA